MLTILSIGRKIVLLLVYTGCLSPVISQEKSGSDRIAGPRKFLLRDEGRSQLSYEDLDNPGHNWYIPVPAGRDMQLVGHDRVLIGTGSGYEEHMISTGRKIAELGSFPGTLAARRLRNGNTLLAGMNWQGKQGIVLVEVDSSGSISQQVNYPQGFSYLRLVRETASGTFLVAAEDTVFEGNAAGEVLWKVKITGVDKPHVWQALRLFDGRTIVSAGYSANLQVFEADGRQSATISGPAAVNPHFYAGFQILANGHYVVTNWQGHGPAFGEKGMQLLEYSQAGELVWSWKQDASKYSSLQGVIVLDGLDTNLMHTENAAGILAPAGK